MGSWLRMLLHRKLTDSWMWSLPSACKLSTFRRTTSRKLRNKIFTTYQCLDRQVQVHVAVNSARCITGILQEHLNRRLLDFCSNNYTLTIGARPRNFFNNWISKQLFILDVNSAATLSYLIVIYYNFCWNDMIHDTLMTLHKLGSSIYSNQSYDLSQKMLFEYSTLHRTAHLSQSLDFEIRITAHHMSSLIYSIIRTIWTPYFELYKRKLYWLIIYCGSLNLQMCSLLLTVIVRSSNQT